MEVAARQVGGGEVLDIDFERNDGRLVFDVEVINDWREYDVKIDATTGRILSFERDD